MSRISTATRCSLVAAAALWLATYDQVVSAISAGQQTAFDSQVVKPAEDERFRDSLPKDPQHDARLKRFVDAMTPAQKIHRTLYSEFGAGPVLDDVVNGNQMFVPRDHDPLSANIPPYGIMETLKARTCAAEGVIVGQVVTSTSNPTERGNYLFTDYNVRIIDVLKETSAGQPAVGGTVIVTRAGGELMVEGKHLDLWTPSFPRLDNQRYVFFGELVKQTKALHVREPEDTLSVDGAQVHRLASGRNLDIERVSLDSLKSAVKQTSCR